MHELSICQALISQVAQVARDKHAATVTDIYVDVGPLSGVEQPLLRNAFPLAAAGTVANNATLHLQPMPIRVRCEECGAESEVAANRLICAGCGDWRTNLLSGDELLLRRVVLEDCKAGENADV